MVILVKGYLTFRPLIPERRIEFIETGVTLRDLLISLAQETDALFKTWIFDHEGSGLQRGVAILINGCHYTHLQEGLEPVLRDGDQVSIFPPIAGG